MTVNSVKQQSVIPVEKAGQVCYARGLAKEIGGASGLLYSRGQRGALPTLGLSLEFISHAG